jgi:hypothetical protein
MPHPHSLNRSGASHRDLSWQTWVRASLSLPSQPHLLFLDPGLGARGDATGPREGEPTPWNTNPMRWYTERGFSVASQVGPKLVLFPMKALEPCPILL